MDRFIAVVVPADHELDELHNDGSVTVYATAVVQREPNGTLSVKQMSDEGPVGAALGTLLGALIGLACTACPCDGASSQGLASWEVTRRPRPVDVHWSFLMNPFRAIPLAAVMAVLVLVACSSDGDGGGTAGADAATGADSSSSNDGGTDSSSSNDSASSTDTSTAACTASPDAGAACNMIANIGTDKPVVASGMTIPVGTGGTILDGRYVLTDFTSYAGSMLAGVTLKQTLELCALVGQFVDDQPGKATAHKSFTLAPSGTAPNVTTTCSTEVPDSNIPYSSYTATTTTLTFYSTTLLFSVTYTKQ